MLILHQIEFCGTHLKPVWQKVPNISIREIGLQNTFAAAVPHVFVPKGDIGDRRPL